MLLRPSLRKISAHDQFSGSQRKPLGNTEERYRSLGESVTNLSQGDGCPRFAACELDHVVHVDLLARTGQLDGEVVTGSPAGELPGRSAAIAGGRRRRADPPRPWLAPPTGDVHFSRAHKTRESALLNEREAGQETPEMDGCCGGFSSAEGCGPTSPG